MKLLHLCNKNKNKSSFVLLSLIVILFTLFGIKPLRAEAASGVYVRDSDGITWAVTPNPPSSVDIFHADYDWDILPKTVKADNGTDKLIAPGTTGLYDFTIYNNRSKAVKYCLEVTEINDDILPIDLFIESQSNLVSQNWTRSKGSSVKEYYGEIPASNSEQIKIQWRWPFEEGEDERDTKFGLDAGAENASTYTLKLNVTVEEDPNSGGSGGTTDSSTPDSSGTPDSSSSNPNGGGTTPSSPNGGNNGGNGTDNFPWRLPQTGEDVARSALVLGIIIIIIVFIIWKIRNKKRDDE